MTNVTVLIITFERYDELKRTISALRDGIKCNDNDIKISWVVSDDSSPDGRKMSNLNRIKDWQDIHFVQTPRRLGWGAHVNWAHEWIKTNLPDTDYLFFCEDDYVLQKPIQIERGVALLNARPNIGMLRYRGTAGTRLVYHQFEAELESPVPAEGSTLLDETDRLTYLHFDAGSHTLWLYSNGPHLKRFKSQMIHDIPALDFHEFYGTYPENLTMGQLEEHYAHNVKNQMKQYPAQAPAIAIFPDWVNMHWWHVGETFQNTEDDITQDT